MQEANFDSLVGPTHHYGGLGLGNLASQQHRGAISHPRRAALQGLDKMKLVADLGAPQYVLPPHPRPHIGFLREQGFRGDARTVLRRVVEERPDLLSVAYSSAAMWTANAATVSAAPDTADGRLHLTPANLASTAHRRLEADVTFRVLRSLFADPDYFVVHPPLTASDDFRDEGAANHSRFTSRIDSTAPGVELFVFGGAATPGADRHFPARQSAAACRRIAKQHGLAPERTVFAAQSAMAIDAGVFHHDVIGVGHENFLLIHEQAWDDQTAVLDQLRKACQPSAGEGFELKVFEVSRRTLSLEAAVDTYLFNSQIITSTAGRRVMLAPTRCDEVPETRAIIKQLIDAGHLSEVRFVELGESLRNGGGPACLRLRVPLREEETDRLRGQLRLTDLLYAQLRVWIQRHYREELTLEDLTDPALPDEVDVALDQLADLLCFSRPDPPLFGP